jgi:hypothetical protein
VAEFGGDRMWGLKEIDLPEPVSWFPATEGWLVIAAAIAVAIGWMGWRRYRKWLSERYRREALTRLSAMRIGKDDTRAPLMDLPLVLRMTALAAYPREEVAGLRGSQWVDWLNANGARFEPNDAAWLDRLPYASSASAALSSDVAARLLETSQHWVRTHRARV